jgi:hypothetical protein
MPGEGRPLCVPHTESQAQEKVSGVLRKLVSRVACVGRTSSMVFGLALVLALKFGMLATALAAVPGDRFRLGQINTTNAITQLVGSRDGAMLSVDNNSAAGKARALDLKVESGRAPMTVNATAGQATNFNADKVDGLHAIRFVSTGNSVCTGSASFCSSQQVSFIAISVTRNSLVYASAHGDVAANGNAGASVLMNMELRNGANTTTLAQTGFGSNVDSANAADIRVVEAEGVLKSGISIPSETLFMVTPGQNYVLRLTASLNRGTCTGSSPYLWDSGLSYILLGTP